MLKYLAYMSAVPSHILWWLRRVHWSKAIHYSVCRWKGSSYLSQLADTSSPNRGLITSLCWKEKTTESRFILICLHWADGQTDRMISARWCPSLFFRLVSNLFQAWAGWLPDQRHFHFLSFELFWFRVLSELQHLLSVNNHSGPFPCTAHWSLWLGFSLWWLLA